MNYEVAYDAFVKRYYKYKDSKIDNSKLYAGSPMYYYCHGCCILVAEKPECWFLDPPPKYCDDCQTLVNEGVLSEALKRVQRG